MTEYTEKQKEQRRNAVNKYQKTVDRVNCMLPKGTKERIQALGYSCNEFIKNCVLAELEKAERYKK